MYYTKQENKNWKMEIFYESYSGNMNLFRNVLGKDVPLWNGKGNIRAE